MTLLTALAVLLWRYSGQRDFVVGTPVANRPDPQLEGLIGCFVNMLPMRMRVQRGMSLRDLLAEARRTALEAYRQQDVPFEQIVGELAPERSLNAAPIVQVVFAMQNAAAEAPRLSGLSIEPFGGGPARVHFELEVQAWEHRDRIGLTWVYSRDLLDEPRVERMMRHYAAVFDALVAAPAQTVEEVTLLGEAERSELLVTWNETAQSVPATTVTALFEAQTARTPDAVALVDIAASEAPSIAGAADRRGADPRGVWPGQSRHLCGAEPAGQWRGALADRTGRRTRRHRGAAASARGGSNRDAAGRAEGRRGVSSRSIPRLLLPTCRRC